MSETIMLSSITTSHICSGNHMLSAKEGPKISFFPNQNWAAEGNTQYGTMKTFLFKLCLR